MEFPVPNSFRSFIIVISWISSSGHWAFFNELSPLLNQSILVIEILRYQDKMYLADTWRNFYLITKGIKNLENEGKRKQTDFFSERSFQCAQWWIFWPKELYAPPQKFSRSSLAYSQKFLWELIFAHPEIIHFWNPIKSLVTTAFSYKFSSIPICYLV